jgi:hypothetical protein
VLARVALVVLALTGAALSFAREVPASCVQQIWPTASAAAVWAYEWLDKQNMNYTQVCTVSGASYIVDMGHFIAGVRAMNGGSNPYANGQLWNKVVAGNENVTGALWMEVEPNPYSQAPGHKNLGLEGAGGVCLWANENNKHHFGRQWAHTGVECYTNSGAINTYLNDVFNPISRLDGALAVAPAFVPWGSLSNSLTTSLINGWSLNTYPDPDAPSGGGGGGGGTTVTCDAATASVSLSNWVERLMPTSNYLQANGMTLALPVSECERVWNINTSLRLAGPTVYDSQLRVNDVVTLTGGNVQDGGLTYTRTSGPITVPANAAVTLTLWYKVTNTNGFTWANETNRHINASADAVTITTPGDGGEGPLVDPGTCEAGWFLTRVVCEIRNFVRETWKFITHDAWVPSAPLTTYFSQIWTMARTRAPFAYFQWTEELVRTTFVTGSLGGQIRGFDYEPCDALHINVDFTPPGMPAGVGVFDFDFCESQAYQFYLSNFFVIANSALLIFVILLAVRIARA